MPRRKPKRSRRPGDPVTTTVRCGDPITGESVSFTVYGRVFADIAAFAQVQLGGHYKTTELTDARHKRR